jgi:predicted SAM-dependent methyltransferase
MQILPKIKTAVKSLISKRQVEKYLATSPQPRLNLGCGVNVVPGWLNVDQITGPPGVVFMDCGDHWPMPDNAFDAVLCEHMIEHVPKEVGRTILSESFRILKPGGAFRAVTPDIEFLARLISEDTDDVKLYMNAIRKFLGKPSMNRIEAINAAFRNYGHIYIYSAEDLGVEIAMTGFEQISVGRGGVPLNPIFQGSEGHNKVIGTQINAIEAFSIEAVKPR